MPGFGRDPSVRAAGGSILMVTAAMGCFAASDTIVKYLAPKLPAVHIAWFRYLFLAASILPFMSKGLVRLDRRHYGVQFGRGICLMASALLLISALRHLPLAQATALAFASPLFVTLLSRVLLKERVDALGWTVVGLGFFGVLIVMRPTASGFTAAALLPIASSLAWAFGMVLTRKTAAQDSSTTMLYSSAVGLILLGGAALPSIVVPRGWDALMVVVMAVLWVAAQWLVLIAYQRSHASRLAPFSYTQLLFATLLGGLMFGHWPDPVSLAGICLIVGCGLVAAWRSAAVAPI